MESQTLTSSQLVSPSKTRVLALHGFLQGPSSFRVRTGSVRSLVKSCEFLFVEAPFHVVSCGDKTKIEWGDCVYEMPRIFDGVESVSDESSMRGWYIRNGDELKGLEESVRFMMEYINKEEYCPIGFGFSQGATVLGICQNRLITSSSPKVFKKLILISPYWPITRPLFPALTELSSKDEKIDTNVLIIVGENDKVVSPECSEATKKELEPFAKDVVIVKHEGGHYIPSGAKYKTLWREWLNIDK